MSGPSDDKSTPSAPPKKRHRFWRKLGITLLVLVVLGAALRLAAPTMVRWYVNRTLDQNPLYDGRIGDVDIHLYRGAYSIEDIRLVKTTGSTIAPLFSAKRIDLAVEWGALFSGKVVGRIVAERPEINFVDGGNESEDQTGAGGPWLEMIQDLFPFDINSAQINDGTLRFRAADKDPPVDMAITDLNVTVENLKNIHDEMKHNIATVKATGLALNHARLQYEMKLDPFSYRPTFQMAMRLVGLDVTKTNDLARAYGQFDFEDGWFDLVVEVDAKEGNFSGYVKPLFRNLKVITLQDVKEDNPLAVFWEALVGGVTKILSNPPRDQFGTLIPMSGDLTAPDTEILSTIGNILRNAFIRAYLPELQNAAPDAASAIRFGPGRDITDPAAAADIH